MFVEVIQKGVIIEYFMLLSPILATTDRQPCSADPPSPGLDRHWAAVEQARRVRRHLPHTRRGEEFATYIPVFLMKKFLHTC